jgi:ABC-2 type transport system permease protein
MLAMIVKEFRQLRRDHRTLAMMIVLPVLLLVVFGYAASFDVDEIPTTVVGPRAERAADALPDPFSVDSVEPSGTRAAAVDDLRDGRAAAAFVTGTGSGAGSGGSGEPGVVVLLDGSELFTANAARAALAQAPAAAGSGSGGGSPTPGDVQVDVLFNEDLKTSAVMVPGLAGLILLFVGTVITSLGVVRERQAGTLEQLAVMPLRPRDVFLGKIAPYFLVATIDLVVVVAVGVLLFDVPFRGSALLLALGALLFLFVTLGIGVLISTVSQNQGQAIQLAIMTLLPQVILSGLIFPVSSMAPGVRWISYLLPLTWFTRITRGVMLRGAGPGPLWPSFAVLAVLGAAVVVLATLRFRRDLAPAPSPAAAPAREAAPAGSPA